MKSIITHLWYDTQAHEAATLYTSLFPDSKITQITHYPNAGREITGKQPGSVMNVVFELNGQTFMALNGGPHFTFNESVSLIVPCETQEEIDRYWDALTADGGEESQCGWLKDKFGLSWQIAPARMDEMFAQGTPEQLDRVMAAFMPMKKIDLAAVEAAYQGT